MSNALALDNYLPSSRRRLDLQESRITLVEGCKAHVEHTTLLETPTINGGPPGSCQLHRPAGRMPGLIETIALFQRRV